WGRVDREGVRWVSLARHGARERLREDVLAALVRVRARAAVAGADRIDDARVDLAQSRIAELEAFHHAGPEVVHDHVGSLDEIAHDLPSALAPQVHLDAPLVPVQAEEHRVVRTRRVLDRPAGTIAGPGPLDPHNLRAGVARPQDPGR